MKPHDLKSPFCWKTRCVSIHDRVWYIPEYYDKYENFSFPGWQHSTTFAKLQPVCVEYCSGNGAWIIDKALKNPHINWLAIEKQFIRARKIWSKIKNYQLDNLLVVCGEGQKVTHLYFPPSSVDKAFINFPDPWPKRRHFKHRIIQPAFIESVAKSLKVTGILTLVTDDQDYSNWSIEHLLKNSSFQSCYPSPYYTTELFDYGTSYFEDLWRQQGKKIYYHRFCKKR